MFRDDLRVGVHHVGLALRDPEAFAVAWNEGRSAYQWPVWVALLATAIVGTTTYGMTMGLLGGGGATSSTRASSARWPPGWLGRFRCPHCTSSTAFPARGSRRAARSWRRS